MYIPLSLRLTLFFTLVLGLALWFFGNTVYTQAAQRAYHDLDTTLSSRAGSVQLGKVLACYITQPPQTYILPALNGLATDGVAIEVLDDHMRLLATTDGNTTDPAQPGVAGIDSSPIPWDAQAANMILKHYTPDGTTGFSNTSDTFSTITYQGQHVRVYTLTNANCAGNIHIIQTARSEQDIEQSLSDLQSLLLRGGAFVLLCTFIGGWLMTWGLLTMVRRMTKTAKNISTSRNFRQRVPNNPRLGRNELSILATTFNEMLSTIEEVYQRQQHFVADASHELRAPITSIRCNLDLLATASDLPPDEAQGALHDARIEADRMGRLVSDLLTLARADQKTAISEVNGYKKIESKEKVDVDSLVLDVFRQYQRGNEHDNMKYKGPRLLLQDITPAQVEGNADQLKQVLVALIDNALKYTPYEGTISLSLTKDEQFAIVKVSDTGIGISPDDLTHIFERFYRADRARSRDHGGSGLGLAIVQSIVQDQQGSIEVESTPGKGSSFVVRLPLAPTL